MKTTSHDDNNDDEMSFTLGLRRSNKFTPLLHPTTFCQSTYNRINVYFNRLLQTTTQHKKNNEQHFVYFLLGLSFGDLETEED